MRALQQLAKHLLLPAPSASDAVLLTRLAAHPADPALGVLMQRHGGLVLGVAQRVLRDVHLAEDAYQATFLLLVRNASTVRHSLPAWLHRVALHLSLRMKTRLRATVELIDTPAKPQPHTVEQADVLGVIDEEIARLPARLRAVVQWCYLNDASTAHAAEELGIPRGTVLSRLDAARRKLQVALTRRGLTNLSILTLPVLTTAVSSALAERTTSTVLAYISGANGPLVSLTAQEIVRMAAQRWMKFLCFGLLATGVGTGLVWLGSPAAVQAQVQGAEKPKPEAKKLDAKEEKVSVVKDRLERVQKEEAELEKLMKHFKEEQLNESTLSDFTLRKLIEETELKILKQAADERNLNDLILQAKQQALTAVDYEKLLDEEKFNEIKFIKLMSADVAIFAEWQIVSTSSAFQPNSTLKKLLEKRAELAKNKRGIEQFKMSRGDLSSPGGLEQVKIRLEQDEQAYKKDLKDNVKTYAVELVKLGDDSIKKVQDALKEKSDSKKSLTTQRKDYLRALAKLTDNTQQTKLQNQLDILRDQKALLGRVLLRLELEAQGITITPEDVPVKKDK
jgi:RNA polymerase sigma factor (sigma-70 family)